MSEKEYQPLYRWKETWPGEGHEDYLAFDGDESFGRIQLEKTAHTKVGMWKWNITHISWVKIHLHPHGGWADTAREASRMVEESYHRLCDAHDRKGSRQG